MYVVEPTALNSIVFMPANKSPTVVMSLAPADVPIFICIKLEVPSLLENDNLYQSPEVVEIACEARPYAVTFVDISSSPLETDSAQFTGVQPVVYWFGRPAP